MALLSIWGIILVVLGHSGFTNDVIQHKLLYLQKWIYSFHMPLFFFISGYLYSLTNKSFTEINSGKFLFKKVKRLLIPYFVLGVIVFAIKYVFAGLSCTSRSFSLESFLYMFVAPHDADSTMGYLWYLLTLFLVFVIVTLFSSCIINLKNAWVCLSVTIISWTVGSMLPKIDFLNLTNLLWYLPFFICGILFCKYNLEQRLSSMNNKSLLFSMLIGGGYAGGLIIYKCPR